MANQNGIDFSVAERLISNMAGKILVGTASWSDPGFVEHWYPKKMKPGERLGWYSQHFEMVEVNSTFYSAPDPRMVERWCAATPDDFVFNVKLHQLFSFHSTPAKLLPPDLQRIAQTNERGRVEVTPQLQDKLIEIFLASMSILRREKKLGALLLQLSPAFSPRKHRLQELQPLIDRIGKYAVAIEFRNRNWAVGDQLASTISFLRKCGAAFVNVDAPSVDHFSIMPTDLNEVPNPELAYLRLHGRDAKAYTTGKTVAARFNYDYSGAEIEEVAERSRTLAKKARDVHIVFNNNALDFAPRAASSLRKALGQMIKTPPQTPELF